MDDRAAPQSHTAEGPQPGRFRWWQLICWLPASTAAGLAIAWAAVVAQRYYAPLVLFPILTGIVLGGVLVALMRLCQIGHRPTLAAGALVAVLLAVAGEHYIAFRQTQQRLEREQGKLAVMRQIEQAWKEASEETRDEVPLPPLDFAGYLGWTADYQGLAIGSVQVRGTLVWLIWAADAALLGTAAVALLALTARLPYCNRCQRWYHTMRSGKTTPGKARALAAVAALEIPAEIHSAHYRLIACQGGCGPSGLALFWEQANRDSSSGYLWLEPAGLRKVLSVLDERMEE